MASVQAGPGSLTRRGPSIERLLKSTLLGATLLVATGCGHSVPTQTPGVGMRLGLVGTFDSVSPALDRSPASRTVQALFSRGMASYTADGTPRPQWLDHLPSRESGDFKALSSSQVEYRLSLRKDACWYFGEALTLDDFLLAYQAASSPYLLPVHQTWVRSTSCMELSAAQGLRMVVRRNLETDFLDNFALPSHLLKTSPISNPIGFRTLDYHAKPLSNGPYTVARSSPSGTLLTINRRFKPHPGHLDWIEVVRYANPQDALGDMRHGTLDLLAQVPIADAQAFTPGPELRLEHTPSSDFLALNFNTRDAALRQPQVRQALAHAIDRTRLVTLLTPGAALPAQSWLPSNHAGYVAAFAAYQGKLAQSQALLAKTSWKVGSDGQLHQGQRVAPLALLFDSDSPVQRACADYLVSSLHDLGLQVTLEGRAHPNYLSELARRTTPLALYDLHIAPWVSPAVWFGQESIPTPRNGLRGYNVSGWSVPEGEALLRRLGSEAAWTDARDALIQLQTLQGREVPFLPLYCKTNNTVLRNSLQGVSPNPYAPITWNAEDWQRK